MFKSLQCVSQLMFCLFSFYFSVLLIDQLVISQLVNFFLLLLFFRFFAKGWKQ